MIFNKLSIYASLIFAFIILADPVSGMQSVDELFNDAEGIVRASHAKAPADYQHDFEGFILRVLKSTGYNITGPEIYLEPTFIAGKIKEQKGLLSFLEDEKRSYELTPSNAEDLSLTLKRKTNEHAFKIETLYLNHLEEQYALLWGSKNTADSHKSPLLPQNLERRWKFGTYYVDPCNMMFLVHPNKYQRANTIFEVLFIMFDLLHRKYKAIGQPIPKALTPYLQSRFDLYTPENKLCTLTNWGRTFMSQERDIFTQGSEELTEEIAFLRLYVNNPFMAENKEICYRRIPEIETAFADLTLQMNALDTDFAILSADMPEEEAEASESSTNVELTTLKHQRDEVTRVFNDLKHSIEEKNRLFNDEKYFVEFSMPQEVEHYFFSLDKMILSFQASSVSCSLTVKQILEELRELKEKEDQELDRNLQSTVDAIADIPVLQESISAAQRQIAETDKAVSSLEVGLGHVLAHARLLDTALSTQQFFHQIGHTFSISLGQLLASLTDLARTTSTIVTQQSKTLSAKSRQTSDNMGALELRVRDLNEKISALIARFYKIFQQAESTQTTFSPDPSLQEDLSQKSNPMQTVTQGIRDLFKELDLIISGDEAHAQLPEILQTDLKETPLPPLLQKFQRPSTAFQTTITLIEEETLRVLQKLDIFKIKLLSSMGN